MDKLQQLKEIINKKVMNDERITLIFIMDKIEELQNTPEEPILPQSKDGTLSYDQALEYVKNNGPTRMKVFFDGDELCEILGELDKGLLSDTTTDEHFTFQLLPQSEELPEVPEFIFTQTLFGTRGSFTPGNDNIKALGEQLQLQNEYLRAIINKLK